MCAAHRILCSGLCRRGIVSAAHAEEDPQDAQPHMALSRPDGTRTNALLLLGRKSMWEPELPIPGATDLAAPLPHSKAPLQAVATEYRRGSCQCPGHVDVHSSARRAELVHGGGWAGLCVSSEQLQRRHHRHASCEIRGQMAELAGERTAPLRIPAGEGIRVQSLDQRLEQLPLTRACTLGVARSVWRELFVRAHIERYMRVSETITPADARDA
jgi:hypothetical protein